MALVSSGISWVGVAVNRLKIAAGVSGLVLALASPVPASAAGAMADGQSAAVSVAASVASFYDTFRTQPIWFRNGADTSAIAQLTAILQRAPFDGFPQGPQVAAQVQSAVAQAASGKPDDVAAAEQVLSSAWVQYVQAVRKPTTRACRGS